MAAAGLLHSDALPDPSPAQFALLMDATVPSASIPQAKRKYGKLQLSLPTLSSWLTPGIRMVVLTCETIYTKDMNEEIMHSWENIPK